MDHAKLSPSASSRWMSCPGSIRLTANMPNTSSPAAERGTMLHELAEEVLKNKDFELPSELDEEGRSIIDDYVNYVLDVMTVTSELFVEGKLSISDYIPGGFGTVDAVVIDGSHCHVIDLKTGSGVQVDAEDNSQLMIYALGVYQEHDWMRDFEQFTLHIVQPPKHNYPQWTISVEDLLKFGEVVKVAAALCLEPDAPFSPSEESCRWCLANATCQALAAHNLGVMQSSFDNIEPISTDLINNEQLALLLSNVKLIKAWAESVESHALHTLSSGEQVPGFKVVQGRSIRKWRDQEAENHITQALGGDAYISKLVSPAQAEKLMPKTEVAKLVVKTEGKPVIARSEDKRPALISLIEMF